jgi:hypothetical protein
LKAASLATKHARQIVSIISLLESVLSLRLIDR